jgi:hypothetical protein
MEFALLRDQKHISSHCEGNVAYSRGRDMSTGYYVDEAIPVAEFFGGRLDKYGVQDSNAPSAGR